MAPPAAIPLVARAPRPIESINPAPETSSGRYMFRKLGGLPRPDTLRAAIITPDGRDAFALGTLGAYRWSGTGWLLVPLPGWLDHGVLHGIAALPDGGLLLFGERGTVLALSSSGEAQPWRLPDDDVKLRGALVDRSGIILVGGRRSRPKGACVEAAFGRPPTVRTIETTATAAECGSTFHRRGHRVR